MCELLKHALEQTNTLFCPLLMFLCLQFCKIKTEASKLHIWRMTLTAASCTNCFNMWPGLPCPVRVAVVWLDKHCFGKDNWQRRAVKNPFVAWIIRVLLVMRMGLCVDVHLSCCCCDCFAGCGWAEKVWFRHELLFPELRPVKWVQELAGQLRELRCRGTHRSLRSTFAGATAAPPPCLYYISP